MSCEKLFFSNVGEHT